MKFKRYLGNLSRAEKILIAMYKMSKGSRNNLKFEDIVVESFKLFPQDFQLRGYPEYPDSGDLIHKPLYDFRKRGYLEANNKVFSFTERGLVYAQQVSKSGTSDGGEAPGRLSRFAEKEISRIEKTEGFDLFIRGEMEKITESDFYTYLGVTPRTPKNDFLGRLETVEAAIKELNSQKKLALSRDRIEPYHRLLVDQKFKSIVDYFKSN